MSLDDLLPCPVIGCEYHLPNPEDSDESRAAFFEEFEQHVRWIHVANKDFGEMPMPSLTGLMMNGLIRPDEFAQLVMGAVNTGIDKVRPRPKFTPKPWHNMLVAGVRGWLIWGVFWSALIVHTTLFNHVYIATMLVLATMLTFYTGALQNALKVLTRPSQELIMVVADDVTSEGEDDEPHL